mmetsp:Transcript_27057/g.69624  ORF Transcript_27057/g.69624 Transcript_27057/m.69624 type:complete len:96 (+) Transcript_27057:137-424(+)
MKYKNSNWKTRAKKQEKKKWRVNEGGRIKETSRYDIQQKRGEGRVGTINNTQPGAYYKPSTKHQVIRTLLKERTAEKVRSRKSRRQRPQANMRTP